jgi:hypothetical protein
MGSLPLLMIFTDGLLAAFRTLIVDYLTQPFPFQFPINRKDQKPYYNFFGREGVSHCLAMMLIKIFQKLILKPAILRRLLFRFHP